MCVVRFLIQSEIVHDDPVWYYNFAKFFTFVVDVLTVTSEFTCLFTKVKTK